MNRVYVVRVRHMLVPPINQRFTITEVYYSHEHNFAHVGKFGVSINMKTKVFVYFDCAC